jgi:phosphoglucosamine mutase
MGRLFGTDGIRGVANIYPMTAEVAMQLGRAVAYLSKRKREHRHKIIIGKDTRLSCYMLESALTAGICSMGVDVLLVGPIPTPGIAFMTCSMRADAGIMISASHNPFQDNGIKIFSRDGYKLPDETELKIEALVSSNSIDSSRPTANGVGKVFRIDDALGRYIEFLKQTFPKEYTLDGMKIAIDCANGATYKVAPAVISELGAETYPLFIEPDGTNINHHCGSQDTKKLADTVIKTGADVGLAFDGDGDRLIAIDETGSEVTGDKMIAICANHLKKKGKLKNNVVVTTVMSNLGLSLALKDAGIEHFRTKVGDRYVIDGMREREAVLGGEDSGHLIFLDHHTTGDGILSALQLLSIMRETGRPLSELSRIMKTFPQVLINVEVRSKPDLSDIPEITNIIKTCEQELGDKGRVLVRYSGTQMLCRIMVEGPTQEKVQEIANKIAKVVKDKLGREL